MNVRNRLPEYSMLRCPRAERIKTRARPGERSAEVGYCINSFIFYLRTCRSFMADYRELSISAAKLLRLPRRRGRLALQQIRETDAVARSAYGVRHGLPGERISPSAGRGQRYCFASAAVAQEPTRP